MKRVLFALSTLLTVSVLLLQTGMASAATPLAYIGYENSKLTLGTGCCNTLYDSWNNQNFIVRVQGKRTYLQNWISSSMSNQGQRSMGVWLKTPPAPTTSNWQDDPNWAKQRIEFEISNNQYFTQNLDDSRYYGVAMYIHPSSPATLKKGAIFMQSWQRHETEDNSGRSSSKHPPFSLRFEDNTDYKWSVRIASDGPNDTRYTSGTEQKIFTSTTGLQRGKWHEFIVRFRPSVTGQGAVQVWHNGTKAVSISQSSGTNIGYKTRTVSDPLIFKDFAVRFGAYRRPEPGNTTDIILMYDQAKFGTSYDSVDP